jgi:two-component system phosphate regulon sensor histidine kinase PhoR
MSSRLSRRSLAAAALLLACLGGAWAAGGSAPAAAFAFAAGLLSAWLLLPSLMRQEPPPAPQAAAAEAESWNGALLELIADPLLVVADGRILLANGAARALMGEGIVGRDARLAIRHPAAVARLSQAIGQGKVEQAEIIGIGGAERRWTMTVGAFDDRHRLVRLEDRSEAFAAEQMRVDFVANASHELRTPLATLLGFTETLRDPGAREDPAVAERFLAIMHDEAKRMQRLIDDLISLSRIEAERFSAPQEEVSLLPLVEESRRNHRHVAKERESRIEIDAPAALPPVAGDRQQLLQLVDNLLSNALRYGRAGSPVTVSLRAAEDLVQLTVSDQGEGIATEHLPRVTQRFYRVDAGRSRTLGGTGLGLSIVKHIVERHRGRLEIRSEPGEGTGVTVSLPAALSSNSHASVTGISRNGPREAANPN